MVYYDNISIESCLSDNKTYNLTADDIETCEDTILQDSKNGKIQPWREKKLFSRNLSLSYHRLAFYCSRSSQPNYNISFKANTLSERFIRRAFAADMCGNSLEFKVYEDSTMKLHNANFCRLRLCPMCGWRRSIKVFSQVSRIMTELEKTTEYEFIFVTLTQKNVYGYELADELTKIYNGFRTLTYRTCKEFNSISKGWFRALEVTHDTNRYITKKMFYKKRKYYESLGLKVGDNNPNYDKYHPHFHVIVAVDKSYFTSKQYLNNSKWTEIWKRCLCIDYKPIVDARKVSKCSKDKNEFITYSKAVAEISKYATKDTDYLTNDRYETDKAVYTLDLALAGRRLLGYGGIFRVLNKQLNHDDAYNGDLIHIEEDEEYTLRQDMDYVVKRYNWRIGFSNYIVSHDNEV